MHIETYDGFTREGTSKYVHALHIGGERWFVELYSSAFFVQIGSITFQAGFEWAER